MSKAVTIFIDGREISAFEGEKLLWVALRNGIYIPNLCAIRGRSALRQLPPLLRPGGGTIRAGYLLHPAC